MGDVVIVKQRNPEFPARYLIQHPDNEMPDEQRAWEIWAVHPLDLDEFDLSREEFILAHIVAAKRQAAQTDR